jgi:uncharacterized protein YbaA (DUF1428 family)
VGGTVFPRAAFAGVASVEALGQYRAVPKQYQSNTKTILKRRQAGALQRRVSMAVYVDGFVLPVPKSNLDAYRKMSQKAGKIFREHGALEYRECVGDDLQTHFGVPFPKTVKVKDGETVVFSWIVYKSKRDRDRINKSVMKDPRLASLTDEKNMPFDVKRMVYGGFKTIVDL